MQQDKRFHHLIVVLLVGACAVVAVSSVPRMLAAESADAQARNEVGQEIAAVVATALDTEQLQRLPDTILALLERHKMIIAVQVVTEDGRSIVLWGAVDKLMERLAAQAPEVHRATLVREGKPWGRVHVLFKAGKSVSALHPASPLFWVTVGLAVVGLPGLMAIVEAVRHRLDRSASGPMAVAADRARHTLDTLAESVLLLDAQGRVMFVNMAFCDIVGAPAAALVGTSAAALPWARHSESDTTGSLPWEQATRESQPRRGTRLELHRAKGSLVFIANCTPLFHKRNALHGMLVTLDDVTELERNRAALQAARDAAERANAAKSQFLAMMSHEIRTPLNGVCGSVQLLKRTGLQARQSKYAEAASFSASTLLHLINDILDFSKIEAGQLELSPIEFDLERCVDDTMLMMVQIASAKGLRLAYKIEPGVCPRFHADPDRIRQIIINLTNNAIKFTEKGSVTLRVSVDSETPEQQMLRCAVTDTGVGIPAAKMDRLFKPFSQVDSSTSRKYGGTGLGLIISKQLCEMMGGRIEVASKEGEGTTFTFFLDLPKVVAPSPEPVSEPAHAAQLAILVGLHPFEVGTAHRALVGLTERVVACESEHDLTRLLEQEPDLAKTGAVLVVRGSATAIEALRGVRVIRDKLPNANVRVIAATFGPEHPPTDEAPDANQWILRPIGANRLRQAIYSKDGHSQQVQTAKQNAAETPTPDLSGLRVLLAEDNPVGQMVVSDMLRGANAQCETASNGHEVLAALDRGQYDVILMDCFMPELDGFETTCRIRALQGEGKLQQRPPIIALTAKAMQGDRETCLAAGMDGYLTKPIDEAELLRTVAKHAGRAEAPSVASPAQPSTAKTEAPRDRPNLTALRKRFSGKSDVFEKLLLSYRETSAEDLHRIDTALGSGDASLLEHAAHRLAGGAGFVSAEHVRRLAMELESRAVARQLDDLAESAQQLRLEVAESIRDLEEMASSL